MIESPYPWNKNHFGKVVHLPFNKNRAHPCDIHKPLEWFIVARSPFKEWWYLNQSESFVEEALISRPENEYYAVQHVDWGSAEKKAKNWRRSHKKERFLMDILWHTVDSRTLVDNTEAINDAIYSCGGIEVTDPVEEAQMREKCKDLVEWISTGNTSSLVRLTPKGFKSIQKLLPPSDAATEVGR